jgi:tripartite-type tricarboxylate transporter receptor subunit TctC
MRLKNLSVLIFICLANTVLAQNYPTRPIRIFIPFTAGSAADIIARAMEPAMHERLGQAWIIDNRGGAGGNIAAELTAKSANDGYTFMMGTVGTQAINMSLYPKLSYNPPKDFMPVTLVGDSPNVLVINPVVPVKSVKQFIALARSRPGQLNYGSSGAGTTVHLAGELFSMMSNTRMQHIPFKGAAESLTALISGETDLQFASISSAITLIKSSRLRALGVTGLKRSASLPDIMTISEAALPGYDAVAWYGLIAPANLPATILNTTHKAAVESLAQTDVKNRLAAAGVDLRILGPVEFAAYSNAEIQKWAKIIKVSGAKAE